MRDNLTLLSILVVSAALSLFGMYALFYDFLNNINIILLNY